MPNPILPAAAHGFRLALEAGAMVWLCTLGMAVVAWIGRLAYRLRRRRTGS